MSKNSLNTLFILTLLNLQVFAQAVEQGTFRLDKAELETTTGLLLNTEWRFTYWSTSNPIDTVQTLIKVPKSWTTLEIDGRNLDRLGTGIYEITLFNPDRLQGLYLLFYSPSFHYKVFANDEQLAVSKKFSDDPDLVPDRKRELIRLPNSDTIRLKILVNNDLLPQSGILRSPVIGLENKLLAKEQLRSNVEMIQIGCLLLLAFYNLFLYYNFKEKAYFYLSALCFVVLIRAVVVFDGSLFFFSLFPSASFQLGKKLEFFTVYSTPVLPLLFMQSLFRDYHFKLYVKILGVFCLILMAIVVITPLHIYLQTLNIYHVAMVISFGLQFTYMYRGIKHKKIGARLLALGFLIAFVFVFIEILINSGLIRFFHQGPNLVNTGVVAFMFIQTIAITRVFSFYQKDAINKEVKLKRSAEEKTVLAEELKSREKELADFTFRMLQRNRLLTDLENLVKDSNANSADMEAGTVVNKLSKIVRTSKSSNDQWEDFSRYFGNVHHDFFSRVKELHPNLSTKDLKHCALLKMGLSMKESAEILVIDTNSIKMARYRLKKKMGLTEEDDLISVITNL
ncbi:MAG: 7TM-DISM domain-containing protein [Cyclobacteriaceae bacterium]